LIHSFQTRPCLRSGFRVLTGSPETIFLKYKRRRFSKKKVNGWQPGFWLGHRVIPGFSFLYFFFNQARFQHRVGWVPGRPAGPDFKIMDWFDMQFFLDLNVFTFNYIIQICNFLNFFLSYGCIRFHQININMMFVKYILICKLCEWTFVFVYGWVFFFFSICNFIFIYINFILYFMVFCIQVVIKKQIIYFPTIDTSFKLYNLSQIT
jgi:hypothetical protein